MIEHLDVLIVGAGISGIGSAYHLQANCPGRTYAILEARDRLGGTWDLFRYPGIRSDSDMYTLGYSFRPWKEQKAIADGDSILRYLEETAAAYGIDEHIRYGHRVTSASWSTAEARWTVDVDLRETGETVPLSCNFLFMCSGYYSYESGYTPDFDGRERFEGQIVHPQAWTDDIAYANKRVVIIGSGATAVTLVPEMAKTAAHVTMLQRSPTYVASVPAEDAIANRLREFLPPRVAYGISRWKNVLRGMFLFNFARRAPELMKKMLVDAVAEELGDDFDVERHFTPRYDPWDQRLCAVPDGDLFEVIRAGRVSVVTDHIDTFTETGILLESGAELPADLVVTATGLRLLVLAGITITVDGSEVRPSSTMTYKAMMLSDVPNFALAFGYTNASWTLKSDLTGEYVCRLLNHMERKGYRRCVPRRETGVSEEPFLDFTSGYILRALADFPKQGSKAPWKLYQNYLLDIVSLRHGRITDRAMEFS